MAVPLKTTTNFNCYLQSQRVSTGDVGSSNEIIEVWIISPKEGIVRPETQMHRTLMAENAVPQIGEYYADWWAAYPSIVLSGNWQGEARCRSHEFTTLVDGNVQATFRFQTFWQKRPGDANTALHLPTTVDVGSSTRTMALFRRNWTTPPIATLDKSAADIGGDAAILGTKEPYDTVVSQARLRVRLVEDAEILPIDGVATIMALAVGKRNEEIFMGFPVQSLVLESFAINKLEGEFYEFTFDAVFDRYYEHDQIPEMDVDGQPKTNNTGTEFSDVRWQRVERETIDFNTFFAYTDANFGLTPDPIRQEIAEKGYWT